MKSFEINVPVENKSGKMHQFNNGNNIRPRRAEFRPNIVSKGLLVQQCSFSFNFQP